MTIPRLPTLAALATAAVATVAPNLASADEIRVRARGKVEVRASGHIRIGGGVRRTRVYRHPHPTKVYVGVRFAEPPPPPPPPPSCYDTCAPPAPVASVVYSPPQPPPPPVPTFGIGLYGGTIGITDETQSQSADPLTGAEVGLFARFRLSHHFRLEGELSQAETTDGARRDQRVGIGLLYDLNPTGSLAPYLVAAVGGGTSERNGGQVVAEQAYAELGLGVEWRLNRHISLLADLRGGALHNKLEYAPTAVALMPAPDATVSGPDLQEDEGLARLRFGAAYYF